MFGDWGWDSQRTDSQIRRLNSWINSLDDAKLVVVECGAGRAIPTVRVTCESLARDRAGTLVRINPREPDIPAGHISLSINARCPARPGYASDRHGPLSTRGLQGMSLD